MRKALFYAGFLSCCWLTCGGEHCESGRKQFYKKFSTKTPYQYIVDELGVQSEQTFSKECEDVQIWSIVRHGTRYPSKKAIKYITQDMVQFKESIIKNENSKLCQADLNLLKHWNPVLSKEQAKDLHREGEEELVYMGERLLDRHPDLLRDYHQKDFLFRATDTQRSIKSMESFVLGLFSRPTASGVTYEDPLRPHDPLIRFYKLCEKWLREVKKHNSSRIEYYKFSESTHIDSIRRKLTDMLGLEEELSMQLLDKIYMSCNFDQAWSPRKQSPWCSLFSDQDLEVLEYREDLEYYWIDGPGYEVSYNAACVLIQNVFQNFKNATSGITEERGIFYFTHSGTILKFLAYLGTHQDPVHLQSNNFHQLKNRKWRTSHIAPFAANISFLLKKCNGVFSVCLFVNEKPERLPGCEDSCCPWHVFQQLYQTKSDSCDLNDVCRNQEYAEQSAAPDDRF